MNFYKHHLGDYAGDTTHLTWDEDMAYTRLMRAYYRREQPIHDAEKYRLSCAQSKPQRAAVDAVLAEFFTLKDGHWHQKRCDEEIALYHEDAIENDAKRENERERQRRHRERRKHLFAELRSHGIVPKWDTPLDELETQLSRAQKRDGNGSGHAPVTQPVTRTATAVREPEPESVRRKPAASRRSRETPLPDDFGISDRVLRWAQDRDIDNLERHFEAFVSKCKAKGYSYIDWDEAFMTAVRDDWAKIGHKAQEQRFPI